MQSFKATEQKVTYPRCLFDTCPVPPPRTLHPLKPELPTIDRAITIAIITVVYYKSDGDVVTPPVGSIPGPGKGSNWRVNLLLASTVER